VSQAAQKTFDQLRFRKAMEKGSISAAQLGGKHIRFECPACGASNRVTVEQIARQIKVPCSGCSKPISLVDKAGGFGKSLRGA
jgi:predicted Zn finger-like uncharacterized protein